MNRKKSIIWLVVLTVFLCGMAVWIFLQISAHIGSAYFGNNKLKVSFLDVGQGDAILIEAPNGVQTLIDSGNGQEILSELKKTLPPFDRKIDILIGTHLDSDHIGGFKNVFDQYEIGTLILAVATSTDLALENLLILAKKDNAKIKNLYQGSKIVLDAEKNIELQIIWPPDIKQTNDNDFSLVSRLIYGENEFLFTGDISITTEFEILKASSTIFCDVLKLGHHGSKTSSSEEFVLAVFSESTATSSNYSVISAGKNNKYGHPDPAVVEMTQQYSTVLKTYEQGTLQFQSDGKNLELNKLDEAGVFQSLKSAFFSNSL